MKNISIKNNEINNTEYSNHKLSILITQDGLSYSLYSISENKFQTLVSKKFNSKSSWLSEIREFVENEKLNNKDFHSVDIIYATNKVSIVPDAIFNKQDVEKIYKLNFYHEPNTRKILSKNLARSSNAIVFSVEKELLELLTSLFTSYNIAPQSSKFIESNFMKNRISNDREKTKMFVQVFEDFMEILVLKDSKIFLYNTFVYQTANDLLYYVINVFEQLKLSQKETEVAFSGFIDTDNLAILNLKKFVQMVYFVSQNIDYKYFYRFQEIAPHYFVNFLNNI
jgi:hypothetical protein